MVAVNPFSACSANGSPCAKSQAGNVLFYILIAVALLGFLTAALNRSGSMFQDVSREEALIKGQQIQRYGAELEQAVRAILNNGVSERDIRFAHASASGSYGVPSAIPPQNQVFSPQGGAAEFRYVPAGANAGNQLPWEFTAHTNFPRVGSPTQPELIAVAPDLNQTVCEQINLSLGQNATIPDTGPGSTPCIYAFTHRFTGTYTDAPGDLHQIDEANFVKLPPTQGCVQCSDNKFYYFYVLLAR